MVLIALSRLTFSRVAMFPSLSFSKDPSAWEGLNKIAESFSASAWTVVLPSSGKRDSALRKLRAGAFLWFALNSMVTLRRVRNVVGRVEVRADVLEGRHTSSHLLQLFSFAKSPTYAIIRCSTPLPSTRQLMRKLSRTRDSLDTEKNRTPTVP